MSHIMVMVRTSGGILVTCPASLEDDGVVWTCALCDRICTASISALKCWRCQCGAEIQFVIDGRFVDPREIDQLAAPGKVAPAQNVPDEDFLTQCGIRPLSEGEKP